jgi:hypothetical protein
MSLLSFLLRPHDGSRCGGGFCRHDQACTSNCAGHPSRNESSDDETPDSWAVICGLGAWVLLIFAVVAAAASIAAFSDWTPAFWPRLVVALS